MVGAERVIWCGSDVTVLEYTDKIILVGPGNDCVPPAPYPVVELHIEDFNEVSLTHRLRHGACDVIDRSR